MGFAIGLAVCAIGFDICDIWALLYVLYVL